MTVDEMGERCRMFESLSPAYTRLIPGLPVMARMDGRSFHSFTKGLDRPFSAPFSDCMVATAMGLAKSYRASCAYTQSDEITLLLMPTGRNGEIAFDGKVYKLLSSLAASVTALFYRQCVARLGSRYADRLPTFDCRVWNVPDAQAAVDEFLWREADATRNSIQMLAQSKFSHKELQCKRQHDLHDMLYGIGINWNDLEPRFKRGTYVQAKYIERPFTTEELDALPERHKARTDHSLTVRRRTFRLYNEAPLSKMSNRMEFLCDGADPMLMSELDNLK